MASSGVSRALCFWEQRTPYVKSRAFPEYLEHMVSKIRDAPSNEQYTSLEKNPLGNEKLKGLFFFFFKHTN